MFLVNSRQGHFTAAPDSSPREVDHQPGHPFSRSYGATSPSSLTRDHSSTLGFSPCLPVSVYGTVTQQTRIEAFLGSMIKASLRPLRDSPSPLGVSGRPDLPRQPPYGLRPALPIAGWPSLLRHPIAQAPVEWYRNVGLFPIAYAFRPRLRGRLTLSGLTFLRKPWASGGGVFHPSYRYSCRHKHFRIVHPTLR